MPLTSVESFKDNNSLPSKPTNSQIETALLFAENELRSWISNDSYDEAKETLEATYPDPLLLLKAKIFRGAEGKLTWYFLLPEINIHVSDFGILLGTDGDREFGGSTIRVAKPAEILAMKKTFWADAWKGVSKYVPSKPVLPVQA